MSRTGGALPAPAKSASRPGFSDWMRTIVDGSAAASLRASASLPRAQAPRKASSPCSAITAPRFSNRSRTSGGPGARLPLPACSRPCQAATGPHHDREATRSIGWACPDAAPSEAGGCPTAASSDLNQWSKASAGRYAIGFYPNGLNREPNSNLYRVIYDRAKQEEAAKRAVEATLSFYHKGLTGERLNDPQQWAREFFPAWDDWIYKLAPSCEIGCLGVGAGIPHRSRT